MCAEDDGGTLRDVQARDTDDEAHRVQIAALRKMGPSERVRVAAEMSEDARRMVMEGVRRRHPEYTEAEVRHASFVIFLGEALASKVWSSPPRP